MEPILSFKSRIEYRKWLKTNCLIVKSIWIQFYKNGTKGISYNDALEESLCFGWIDSLIKRIDDITYIRKFSRRNPNSKWSRVNKAKALKLIDNGLMTKHGLKSIEDAKNNGQWNKIVKKINTDDFREVIIPYLSDPGIYNNLSESLKNHYSLYYFSAKKPETQKKRLDIIIKYMKTKRRIM